MESHPRNNGGFTLVELLIVLTIILVLASIGIASYLQAGKQTRDKIRLTDMAELEYTLELYYSVNGEYPKTVNGDGTEAFEYFVGVLDPKYIATIPTDPLVKTYTDADMKKVYNYSTFWDDDGVAPGVNDGQGYILITKLESKKDYPYCYIVGGNRAEPSTVYDEEKGLSNGWPIGQYGEANIADKNCKDLIKKQ